ncbi:hypothetical protein Dimus_005687, partial [Dionaea muscipula]
RSRRRSPSAHPAGLELGIDRVSELPSIEEAVDSEDELAERSDIAVDLVSASSSVISGSEPQSPRSPAVISPLPSPLEVSAEACVAETQDSSAPIETKDDDGLLAGGSHQSSIIVVSSSHSSLLRFSRFTAESGVDSSADRSCSKLEEGEEMADSVEQEDGQRLHVAGEMAVRLSPVDGRQQQPPLPAAPILVEGVVLAGAGSRRCVGSGFSLLLAISRVWVGVLKWMGAWLVWGRVVLTPPLSGRIRDLMCDFTLCRR